jgi:hypothetical protein
MRRLVCALVSVAHVARLLVAVAHLAPLPWLLPQPQPTAELVHNHNHVRQSVVLPFVPAAATAVRRQRKRWLVEPRLSLSFGKSVVVALVHTPAPASDSGAVHICEHQISRRQHDFRYAPHAYTYACIHA